MRTEGLAKNGDVELFWTLSPGSDPDGAKPLLLINGLGSPLVSYEDDFVASFIDRGFSVARFDNRDIGKSSRTGQDGGPSADYRVADMAVDAVAVLDALGWSSAHVVGQSMGGMIAQQLTIDHPDRVKSLVSLMSASGERGFGAPSAEAMSALMQPAPAEFAPWLEHRVTTEQIWASPAHWSEAWSRSKGTVMFEHGIDPKGTARQFRAIQASGSRDEQLAQLATPTLVIHGDADTLIQPDGGRHVADIVPGARYVEIEGMGHDLPPALWPRLVDEIGAFVAGLDG